MILLSGPISCGQNIDGTPGASRTQEVKPPSRLIHLRFVPRECVILNDGQVKTRSASLRASHASGGRPPIPVSTPPRRVFLPGLGCSPLITLLVHSLYRPAFHYSPAPGADALFPLVLPPRNQSFPDGFASSATSQDRLRQRRLRAAVWNLPAVALRIASAYSVSRLPTSAACRKTRADSLQIGPPLILMPEESGQVSAVLDHPNTIPNRCAFSRNGFLLRRFRGVFKGSLNPAAATAAILDQTPSQFVGCELSAGSA